MIAQISAPRLTGVRLSVANLERSLDFYTDLLGFEHLVDTHDEIELRLGEMTLALRQAAPKTLRGMPADSRANDAGSATSRSWCAT
ncbi:MAG: VOC family protein [Burkholderiales bacterium]